MKRIIKKGIVVISIYLIAVATTLLISDRMEELDRKDTSLNNQALSINFSK